MRDLAMVALDCILAAWGINVCVLEHVHWNSFWLGIP
jgi:hypothetical protein